MSSQSPSPPRSLEAIECSWRVWILQEKHEQESRFSDLLFYLARVSREERASNLPFQDEIGGLLSLICWGKRGQDVGGESRPVPEVQIKSLGLVIGLRVEGRYYQVTSMCGVERVERRRSSRPLGGSEAPALKLDGYSRKTDP